MKKTRYPKVFSKKAEEHFSTNIKKISASTAVIESTNHQGVVVKSVKILLMPSKDRLFGSRIAS